MLDLLLPLLLLPLLLPNIHLLPHLLRQRHPLLRRHRSMGLFLVLDLPLQKR